MISPPEQSTRVNVHQVFSQLHIKLVEVGYDFFSLQSEVQVTFMKTI